MQDGSVALVAWRCKAGLIVKHAARSRPWSPPRSAFVGFRFPSEVIVVAVRWYLRYSLSYRDVEELLAERGIAVDHVASLQNRRRGHDELGIDAPPALRLAPNVRAITQSARYPRSGNEPMSCTNAGGRYWDRTSDLFRVKIARTMALTCQNVVLAGQRQVRQVR